MDKAVGYLQVVDLLLLLFNVRRQLLVQTREILEVVRALRGLLQVVEVRGLEVLLQLLDLRVQRDAQHVDLLQVAVADLLAQLLEGVLGLAVASVLLLLDGLDDRRQLALLAAELAQHGLLLRQEVRLQHLQLVLEVPLQCV